ncbi:type II secretion system protein N [Pseudomonas sp. dw_358]|uniref:type II secretion system protein N n=1 Tax=Pseudomonas sp. dw_358 TaxID=2720083 RepID=UPI001BD4E2B7|nr:type II secretion system protein N [Pseudomonas sp. dw_358]
MKPLTATLWLLITALVAALAWCALANPRALVWLPVAALPKVNNPAPVALAVADLSSEERAVAWQQPLFSPDRQPDLARASAASTSLDGLALGGVMLHGKEQWALLRQRDKRALKLQPGDRLDNGWTVQQLTATSVTFQRQGQTQTLNLPVPRLPAPAAAPVLPPSHVVTP